VAGDLLINIILKLEIKLKCCLLEPRGFHPLLERSSTHRLSESYDVTICKVCVWVLFGVGFLFPTLLDLLSMHMLEFVSSIGKYMI
jgi:hypothetical protein